RRQAENPHANPLDRPDDKRDEDRFSVLDDVGREPWEARLRTRALPLRSPEVELVVSNGHGRVADTIHGLHRRVIRFFPSLLEDQSLRRGSLDRVAGVEQQRGPPLRARGGDGRGYPGEAFSIVAIGDL